MRRRFRGEFDLGFDGRLAQCLHRARMPAQIHSVLGVYLVQRNGQQQVIDVVAAQVRIAVGGLHLEDSVAQFEDGNIKRPAAQIVNRDGAHFRAIQPIGQRGRGRFVDQPQHFEASHAARILGGLALRIVEVRWHRDHSLRNRRAKEPLRVALELAQNVGRYLRRRELEFAQSDARHLTLFHVLGQPEGKQFQLVLNLFEVPAHQPLDRIDDPLRRLDERPARWVPHGNRGTATPDRNRVQRHHRRHQIRAVHAGNHHRRIALHISDQGIGSSQIYSNYASFRHDFI